MIDRGGPYGAVLIVRIWCELPASDATLRARLIHNPDSTSAEAESVVVTGVDRTTEVIRRWLEGYLEACRR